MEKYTLKTSLQRRINEQKVLVGYRLRFSRKGQNLQKVRMLVKLHMHRCMHYKLGQASRTDLLIQSVCFTHLLKNVKNVL